MENPGYFLYGPGSARIQDQGTPPPLGPHDVLVRINFIGVCGSDVHFWRHGGIQTSVTEPLVMGHEASGTIVSVGTSVTSLSVGDRVVIEPGVPCRNCQACKNGIYNLCPEMKFAAAPPDSHGTLTKFWRSPVDFAHKIADDCSLEEAVLIEPLSVAVHAIRLSNLSPGQSVLITGSGTIGLLCGAVAKAFGASRIILLDISQRKVDFAKSYLGIDAHLVDKDTLPEEITAQITKEFELGPEGGVDAVFEASGAESSMALGVYLARPGGQYVQVGIGQPKTQFPILTLSEKELHLHGCFRYGYGDFKLATSLVVDKKVNLKPLISTITPFERAPDAWEKTGRGEGVKNLIEGVRD